MLRNKIILLFILFFVIVYSLYSKNPLLKNKIMVNIKKVNLNLPLLPDDIYSLILCRKSINITVSTTLCVHDFSIDHFISRFIWRYGYIERNTIGNFIEFTKILFN